MPRLFSDNFFHHVLLLILFGSMITLWGCTKKKALKEQKFNEKELAPFVEPDFPFITTSVDARQLGPAFPNDNIIPRCLALRLGGQAYACFDTDLLRWSAAWTGEFLSMVAMPQVSYRDFYNKKNGIPRILGEPKIATGLYPGWSGPEPVFTDPRPPSPNPNGPSWGPIPLEMGRWNGVYLQGREMILSYTIQDTDIFEKPGSITGEEETAFTRTFQIDDRPQQALSLIAAEVSNGVRSEVTGNMAFIYHGEAEDMVTAIGLPGAAPGVKVDITENRYATVHISPGNGSVKFTSVLWKGPAERKETFRQMLSKAESTMPAFREGGPPYWTETVRTRGELAPDTAAYVTDLLTLPIPNPWKRNVRMVDIAFFSDSRAAMATFDGDVWILEGIDRDLDNLKWRRYASGLHEPQSIEVVRDTVYVFGREGIVRFHDLNDDGVADFYENFSNRMAQSMETREWASDLVAAPEGGFYIAKAGAGDAGPKTTSDRVISGFRYGSRHSGSVLKVSPDGRSIQYYATGLRGAYLGIHPETGVLSASDQQGHFVPSSLVRIVHKGDYYGVPITAHRDPVPEIDPPLAWIPHSVDRSGGGQVWITGDQMGPLSGNMVHLSYGRPGLFKVLMDSTSRAVQGGVSFIKSYYPAPTTKGAMNPEDGQVYATGFSLWGSNAEELSALIRLRYTGSTSLLPEKFHVREGGVMIRFGTELDKETAENPANYRVKRWNYLRSENYGSGHYKLDGSPGEELLPVFSAHLSEDRRSVFVAIPDIKKVMQMQLSYTIKSDGGAVMDDALYFTVHDVEEPDLVALGFPGLDTDRLLAADETEGNVADNQEEPASAERGRTLFQNTGCIGCHSVDGGRQGGNLGPPMQGLFGSERHFEDGSSTIADEAYLRQSTLQPGERIVEGYEGEMPSFSGILSDNDIESIILYIKSLSKNHTP